MLPPTMLMAHAWVELEAASTGLAALEAASALWVAREAASVALGTASAVRVAREAASVASALEGRRALLLRVAGNKEDKS